MVKIPRADKSVNSRSRRLVEKQHHSSTICWFLLTHKSQNGAQPTVKSHLNFLSQIISARKFYNGRPACSVLHGQNSPVYLLLTDKHVSVGSVNYSLKMIWLHFYFTHYLTGSFFQNSSWFMIEVIKTFCYIVKIYWLAARHKPFLRYHPIFFDCLVHPNLSATLATDQKWPLRHLHIIYQSLAITINHCTN